MKSKIISSPFYWDGSFLPIFTKENIIHEITDIKTKIKYWTISYLGHTTICIPRKVENASICIYDELMKVFNLPKMGSHYVKLGSKMVVLLKANIKRNNGISSEMILSTQEIENIPENIKEKIRITYTVRDILGVSSTTDSDLVIRYPQCPNYPYYVISMKTYIINEKILNNNLSTITDVAFTKWYKNIEIWDVYSQLFPSIKKLDDIAVYTLKFKTKLDEIIQRVDKSFCYISNLIVNRVTNRLVRMLNR